MPDKRSNLALGGLDAPSLFKNLKLYLSSGPNLAWLREKLSLLRGRVHDGYLAVFSGLGRPALARVTVPYRNEPRTRG